MRVRFPPYIPRRWHMTSTPSSKNLVHSWYPGLMLASKLGIWPSVLTSTLRSGLLYSAGSQVYGIWVHMPEFILSRINAVVFVMPYLPRWQTVLGTGLWRCTSQLAWCLPYLQRPSWAPNLCREQQRQWMTVSGLVRSTTPLGSIAMPMHQQESMNSLGNNYQPSVCTVCIGVWTMAFSISFMNSKSQRNQCQCPQIWTTGIVVIVNNCNLESSCYHSFVSKPAPILLVIPGLR